MIIILQLFGVKPYECNRIIAALEKQIFTRTRFSRINLRCLLPRIRAHPAQRVKRTRLRKQKFFLAAPFSFTSRRNIFAAVEISASVAHRLQCTHGRLAKRFRFHNNRDTTRMTYIKNFPGSVCLRRKIISAAVCVRLYRCSCTRRQVRWPALKYLYTSYCTEETARAPSEKRMRLTPIRGVPRNDLARPERVRATI